MRCASRRLAHWSQTHLPRLPAQGVAQQLLFCVAENQLQIEAITIPGADHAGCAMPPQ